MSTLILIGLLALNAFISWLNCRTVGSIWVESRILGGFSRVLAWCGAVQAAVGFSSVVLFFGILVGVGGHWLPLAIAHKAASLWYLLIVVPALGTGLIITVQSWVVAFRERSIANFGAAAYNTAAMASNIYSALDGVPAAFRDVASLFKGDSDEDNSAAALVFVIAIGSILAGVVLTWWLIRHYARQERLVAMPV